MNPYVHRRKNRSISKKEFLFLTWKLLISSFHYRCQLFNYSGCYKTDWCDDAHKEFSDHFVVIYPMANWTCMRPIDIPQTIKCE
jgi:hypothetical protein